MHVLLFVRIGCFPPYGRYMTQIEPAMRSQRDEFLPTRRSLLSRIKNWDDHQSWRDFFNTYWKLIYSTATKAGLSDAEAQDVVQETVTTVAKKIKDLKYDPALGSFKGWLLNTTRWRIADQLRKRLPTDSRRSHAGEEGDRGTSTVARVPDPSGFDLDAVWDEEWRKNLMEAALAAVRKQVSPKQYQVFDLYVVKQWPVGKVAKTLEVSTALVYVAKHRVAKLVKRELERLEAEFV